MIKGVDISLYQGDVDYNSLKNKVDFVIIKATEGTTLIDVKFLKNQANARIANMLIGYYHFAKPDLGNSATAEADFFVKTIGKLQSGECLFLDFEVNYTDKVNWCKAWLDRVFAKTGVKPLIYLNKSHLSSDWTPVVEGDYGLWLADYNPLTMESPTGNWKLLAFRQYSSTGKVDGISGNVDEDVFYGETSTFKLYGYKPTVTNPPIDLQTQLNAANKLIQTLQTNNDILKMRLNTYDKMSGVDLIVLGLKRLGK